MEVNCAPAGAGKGGNFGMNTVDFAIHNILAESGLLERVRLQRPWPAYLPDASGKLPPSHSLDAWPMQFHHKMYADALDPPKVVVFWGDFQHGRDYLTRAAGQLSKMPSNGCDSNEALDRCYQHFMLEKSLSKDCDTNIGLFGGTLFQNRIEDYFDERYRTALERLVNRASLIRFRDPYSAMKVSEIRSDFSLSHWGTDAALLSRADELLSLPQNAPAKLNEFQGSVGLFLGRSSHAVPLWRVARFVKSLSRRLKANVSWIPWDRFSSSLFGSRYRRIKFYLGKHVKIDAESPITAGDVLAAVNKCACIVTDTYHLALNALRLGVPAICLFEPSPSVARNANMGFHTSWRDKRVLFYLTYELADFLISTTDILSRKWREERAENVVAIMRDGDKLSSIFARIYKHAEECRSEVARFLITNCAT